MSIMAGLASYKAISVLIPGLSRYHYTIANLHRLQFGRGAYVTYQPLVRVRVERQQLDHFLSFITSPHVGQESDAIDTQSLKAAKLYLKGDFKVKVVSLRTNL